MYQEYIKSIIRNLMEVVCVISHSSISLTLVRISAFQSSLRMPQCTKIFGKTPDHISLKIDGIHRDEQSA